MHDFDPLGSNLIFLISLPRSGSTLLQRILGGHPDIATLAEPWLMLHPLYALKRAGIETEYDAYWAREALDDFLSQIDGGEVAYVEGIRNFAGDLYARALARQGKRLFLDKTPRYYRIIPELRQVFPRAKFIILLRNPLAVLASTLRTWFEDDPDRLNGTASHRDLLDGPALLLAGKEALGQDAIIVQYEELVTEPARVVAGLCARLGLAFHPAMLEYGQHPAPLGRLGDQIGVPQHSSATVEHRDKWSGYLADPARRFSALDYLDQLGDATLAALGFDGIELRNALLVVQAQSAAGVEDETPRARADRLNAEGESRFAQGDFEAARQCFEAACVSDPVSATARNNLMVLFWETGQIEAALAQLADALAQTPDDRDLVMNGVKILHALDHTEEARGLWQAYLDKHPGDTELRALLADVVGPQNSEPKQRVIVSDSINNGVVQVMDFAASGVRAPKISVVIPSFNQGRFIETTLRSIFDQNYPNLEVIVMDGGSTDNSVDIIKKYADRIDYWKSEPDAGQYWAINEGFRRSTGEIMTWINSDDMLHPGAFDAIASVFSQLRSADWITGIPNAMDENGILQWVCNPLPVYSRSNYLNKRYDYPHYIQQEGTFWRRSLWEKAGGTLRTDLQMAGDLELWTRFFRYAPLYTVDTYTGCFRQQREQKTAQAMSLYHDEASRILDEEILHSRATETVVIPPVAPIRLERCQVAGVITVATSIAPRGIKKQQCAIASWQTLGFHVVSLNTPEEITKLQGLFPHVKFIAVSRHGKQLAGKPYVFLDDVLAYLRDAARDGICGIINSDIILRAGLDLPAYLWREAEGGLVYGSRVDIRSAKDAKGQLYSHGFDFFFFDWAVIDRLPKTNLMLGVPWWDYWVPIGFQLAGVTIKRLDSRIALHVWHTTNYSTEVLIRFGHEFTRHCAEAPFLDSYSQAQKIHLGDAAMRILSEAVRDYINRNTSKITLSGVPGTEPVRRDHPRVSAIVSTYKSAAFIGECLEDLTGQTIADRIEIIVIDAASPEDERSVVADYQRRYPHIPIRYHRTDSRIGVYAAWNLAARMAQGDYLISCSTNDRLRSDACEILARTLDERPDVALVYGNSFMTQSPHQRFETAELCSVYMWPEFRYEELIDRCMVGPHPMWRREVHERIGYFDDRYIALGDQEFWLRLGESEKLLSIPDFTGLYFVSEHSLTGNGDVAQRETDAVHSQYQWRYRYAQWRKLSGRRRPDTAGLEDLPMLHVAVLVPPNGLARAADSLDALGVQAYPQLRVSILAHEFPPDPALLEGTGLEWLRYSSVQDLPGLVGDLAENTTAEWLCLIDAGDRLAADALVDAARYAMRYPEWQILYSDDDHQGDGRETTPPRFKPDFNLGLLRCQPYIGSCVLIRPDALRTVGGLVTLADWRGADLALRVADRFGHAAVGHVSRVLVHYAEDHSRVWPTLPDMGDYRQSVQAHLQHRGLEADVVPGQADGTLHVRLVRYDQPLVSIIVHGGNSAERQLALQTLLSKTGYANYEVLVLQGTDAEYVDPGALHHGERIRPLATPGLSPGAAMNTAAAAARGEYLLWFDGRCLVLHTDWLERMLRQIAEPDVGMVGARLVDRRKTLLDGGVVLGLGTRCVGVRANTGLHMSSPGYLNRALCEQDLSAVTSLCMLVRKTVHTEAGGFAEDISTGLYRDVDYCLKVGANGWRIVWTPAVTLMFLAGNAEADHPPKDKAALDADNRRTLDRWFDHIAHERTFNRNLDHQRSDFQLGLSAVPNWDPVADRLPRILGYGTGSYGSWQYRVCQPLETLDASGMTQCALTPFSGKKTVILPTPVDIEHMQPQTLLMHNTLHDNYLDLIEQYRRYNRVSLVFGQDDLMFAMPPKNPYSKTVYKDIKKRIRRCIEMSDRVVVTTEPLADALREFSAQIEVVPNYLSRSVWGDLRSRRRQGRRPRVGWAGAQQHGGDLELLYEVVEATADEMDWVFFGMCPDPLRPHVREIHRAVDFAEYPARLAALDLDLAIAPLERNRFNEAKSNLRVLEYGVLGWPVIASDIEPYQAGPICRVANTPGAWIRAIREHVSDRDALAKAGDTLQAWVKTHWMLDDHLNDWLTVLCPSGGQELRARFPKEAASL